MKVQYLVTDHTNTKAHERVKPLQKINHNGYQDEIDVEWYAKKKLLKIIEPAKNNMTIKYRSFLNNFNVDELMRYDSILIFVESSLIFQEIP
ncbi:MAG: hypothetical protein HeimC3_49420 [Candidatus Heimdallarchaeota archaeon LC_3]|nr:MAG: hypothetical protein HeimC3_49420 [Candidatus Heimdallarchaeota archaeon LC_3]